MENKQIIFFGTVVDVIDKAGLGRIRVIPQNKDIFSELERLQIAGNINLNDILNNDQSDIIDAYKFGEYDPFIFSPLSADINIQPGIGELVRVMYNNADDNSGRKDQIYLGRIITSPLNISHENSNQSYGATSQGFNLKPPADIVKSNGEYTEKKIEGIFAKPEDNCLYGRGSTDLILKKNEVLLRAGKVNEMFIGRTPVPNTNLGFLQISYFDSDKINLGPQKISSFSEPDNPVRLLVEYDITAGLDSTEESPILSGVLKIYTIPNLKEMSQKVFNFSTSMPESVKDNPPLVSYSLEELTIESIAEIINTILRALINNQKIDISGAPSFTPPGDSFPFFFRPSNGLRQILQNIPSTASQVGELVTYDNVVKLFKLLKPIDSFKDFGFGLVSQKGKLGKILNRNTILTTPSEYNGKKTSISVLASNKIYLTHYNDKISLKDTEIYGLNIDKISNIHANTHPTVRGDKLFQFLEALVNYVLTHQHACSGCNPVSFNDVTSTLTQLKESFVKDVLNDDIRIS
jgi:hypothetical protein